MTQRSEPAPAPNLSRTPGRVDSVRGPLIGEHTTEVLRELGLSQADIDQLTQDGVVEQAAVSKL